MLNNCIILFGTVDSVDVQVVDVLFSLQQLTTADRSFLTEVHFK